jgi:hypothetical protein
METETAGYLDTCCSLDAQLQIAPAASGPPDHDQHQRAGHVIHCPESRTLEGSRA